MKRVCHYFAYDLANGKADFPVMPLGQNDRVKYPFAVIAAFDRPSGNPEADASGGEIVALCFDAQNAKAIAGALSALIR